jgi:LysM repeat protein
MRLMKPRRQQEARLMLSAVVAFGLLGCARKPMRHEPQPPARAPLTATARGAPRPDTSLYVVRAGESLSAIARCSGVSVIALARDNGIPDPNVVYAGEKLRLPPGHSCDDAVPSPPPAPRPPAATHPRARSLLSEATAALDAADFERALQLADQCVEGTPTHHPDAKAKQLRARCHVVAATAATGMDKRDLALAELRRALELDPDLELAPESSSPRVRELLEVARSTPPP